jgi:hypothetical protein
MEIHQEFMFSVVSRDYQKTRAFFTIHDYNYRHKPLATFKPYWHGHYKVHKIYFGLKTEALTISLRHEK